MSVVRIGRLRYDVVSDTSSFTRGMRATRGELKQAEAAYKRSLSPMEKINQQLIRAGELRRKNYISEEVYQKELKRIRAMEAAQIKQIERGWLAAARAKLGYNAASKAGAGSSGLANLGGSIGSAAGFGGAGAGMGRMLGYGGAGVLAAGALSAVKASREFAKLETALVDLQVLLGNDEGAEFVEGLKQIARTTPLTTSGLVKNAQTMIAYGVSANGLKDTLYRLGEVAGGNQEKFDRLAVAFSQVKSNGKLMGQEFIQLVNAGYPVAEVAKAAGVEMSDFRKEMEKGNISAQHLMESLRTVTSEGGLMYGRLSRGAQTLQGTWDRTIGLMNERWAEAGEKTQEEAKRIIGGLHSLSDAAANVTEQFGYMWTALFGGSSYDSSSRKSWWEQEISQISRYLAIVKRSNDIAREGGWMNFWLKGGVSEADWKAAEAEWEATYGSEAAEKKASTEARTQKELEEVKAQEELEAAAKLKKQRDADLAEQQRDEESRQQEFEHSQMSERERMLKRHWKERADLDKKMLNEGPWNENGDAATFSEYQKIKQGMDERQKAELAAQDAKEQDEWNERNSRRVEKKLMEKLRNARRENRDKLQGINEQQRDETRRLSKANQAASSFGAGTAGEYDFMKNLALSRRGNDKQREIDKRAQDARDKANKHLRKISKAVQRQAQDEGVDIEIGLIK